jgi:hypothetical protein
MNSLGVYEIPMTIRGRKFVHPVTVVEDINDNIIGIDFMHQKNELWHTFQTNNLLAHAYQCSLCG